VLRRGHRIFGVGVASSILMATLFNIVIALVERRYLGFRHEVRAARSVAEEPEAP
jgi:hypothetical protein